MRLVNYLDLLIKTGQLVGYLKGAYSCVREIVAILYNATDIDETVEALDAGLGL